MEFGRAELSKGFVAAIPFGHVMGTTASVFVIFIRAIHFRSKNVGSVFAGATEQGNDYQRIRTRSHNELRIGSQSSSPDQERTVRT